MKLEAAVKLTLMQGYVSRVIIFIGVKPCHNESLTSQGYLLALRFTALQVRKPFFAEPILNPNLILFQ